MFDTHTHLNFSRFKKNGDDVIKRAHAAGVTTMVIPGTDVPTSQKAVEIASVNEGIYAAVGIHPHHVFDLLQKHEKGEAELVEIETLLQDPSVVAVGEVGLDRHVYEETKYAEYVVNDDFILLQNDLLRKQVLLAIKHKKSLILHNREAREDMLPILRTIWDPFLEGRSVFHCCEPDPEGISEDSSLLEFAKQHHMYIGVDGDFTYFESKKQFIKTVPLEMLVLETDSPFLLPEPLRTLKKFPNEPMNISFVAEMVATVKGISVDEVKKQTTKNAESLFHL